MVNGERTRTSFRKGCEPGPGRPKGYLNAKTIAIRELASSLIDDPVYQQNLRERILAGKADHAELFLLQHCFGKPPDKVQVEAQHRVLNIVLRRELGTFDPLAPEAALTKASEPLALPQAKGVLLAVPAESSPS